jgi:exocyst complex protein 7
VILHADPSASDLNSSHFLLSHFLKCCASLFGVFRALPWDTAIGEEALDLDAFVRHLVMILLSNLQSKAKNYLNQQDDLAHTVRLDILHILLQSYRYDILHYFLCYSNLTDFSCLYFALIFASFQAKAPLFMINNTFYLLEQVGSAGVKKQNSKSKQDDEEQYSLEHASWYKEKVGSMYQAQKEIYLAHWDVLNRHLTTVDKSELQYEKKGTLLSLESGRLIKTRFSGFIEEFAELYQTHKPLMVIDAKLRLSLQNDVRNVFLPRYKNFFDKYARIQFSKKNQDQYLKYPPAKVDSLIGDLYETL